MKYLSDIEIAQSVQMQPIMNIASKLDISEEYVEQYGKYKAKINYQPILKNSSKNVRTTI